MTVVTVFVFTVTVVNVATTKGMLIYSNFTGQYVHKSKGHLLVYLHLIEYILSKFLIFKISSCL